jgi:hypothetical protein
MRPFKFLNKNQPELIIFNLNVMTDPLSRIPNYNVHIEPFDFVPSEERTGSIRDIIYGVVQLPTQIFLGAVLTRRDGSHTEINYHDVDELNSRNLIFDINDRITLVYRT